jgi:hypothetical protein
LYQAKAHSPPLAYNISLTAGLKLPPDTFSIKKMNATNAIPIGIASPVARITPKNIYILILFFYYFIILYEI